MNLLAHAVLSPPNPMIFIGNFATDFISSSEINSLHLDLQVGTALHREIDRFTDSHHAVLEAKSILVGYQRFANPLVDIFFDHLLTHHWSEAEDLNTFIANTYKTIEAHRSQLPEPASNILADVVSTDWLGKYQSVSGLQLTLQRIERRLNFRTGRQVALTGSLNFLEQHRDRFESLFLEFWPDLRVHVSNFPIN
jgi:acyl carrier protein phosphodiesterase